MPVPEHPTSGEVDLHDGDLHGVPRGDRNSGIRRERTVSALTGIRVVVEGCWGAVRRIGGGNGEVRSNSKPHGAASDRLRRVPPSASPQTANPKPGPKGGLSSGGQALAHVRTVQ